MASVSKETPAQAQARLYINDQLDTVDNTTLAKLNLKYKNQISGLQELVNTLNSQANSISQIKDEITSYEQSIKQLVRKGKKEAALPKQREKKSKERNLVLINQQASNVISQGKILVKIHVLKHLFASDTSLLVKREVATRLKSISRKQKGGRKSRKHRRYKKRKHTVSNKVK